MDRRLMTVVGSVVALAAIIYIFRPVHADGIAGAAAPVGQHPYIVQLGGSYVNLDHVTHIYPWKAGADQHHVLRVEFDTAVSTEIDAQDFTGSEEAQLILALRAVTH